MDYIYIDNARYTPSIFKNGLFKVLKETSNKYYTIKLDLIPLAYIGSVTKYFKSSKDFNVILDKNIIIKFSRYVEMISYAFNKNKLNTKINIDYTEVKKVHNIDKKNILLIIEKHNLYNDKYIK